MLKNGVKINKRKMIGKHQTSSREPLIWCFGTESKRFLLSRTEFSLVSMFNTKGVDVPNQRTRYEISRCREG